MTTTCLKKKDYCTLALLSFGIALIAILPILIANNGNLYLLGDHMTQQIPFIKESRRLILSGKPFWSWNTFLGSNFLGAYSFYVYGSPFFWPLLLFSDKHVAIGMALMFVLKHVVAALSACLYLKKHVNNQHYAFIGGLLYTFSSFTIDSTYYYHFLDVIAFFPLLLYAVDEILENRKKVLLALTTLLCAVTNYYFFISTSVFVLIYVIFRVKNNKEYTFKRVLNGIVFYFLGTMASMIVLLPSIMCMLETSKATDSTSNIFAMFALFFAQITELLKGIVLPSEGILQSGSGIKMSQFCSNAAFIPVFGAFFLFTAFQMKRDDWSFKLAKFLFIISFIPFASGFFNLFTNINYTRWWYAFVLIITCVSLKVLEENKDNHEKAIPLYKKSAKAIAIITLVTVIGIIFIKFLTAHVFKDAIVKLFDDKVPNSLYTSGLLTPFNKIVFTYVIILAIMIVLNYGSLALLIKKKWVYDSKRVVVTICIVSTICYGVYLANERQGFTTRVGAYIDNTLINEDVEYDHRVSNSGVIANYSMLNNQPAISTFHSIKSHATTSFGRIVGYEIDDNPDITAHFNTGAINTVLSVSSKRNQNGGYDETQHYVPMGYVYDYYVIDNCEFTKDTSVNNSRIQTMVYACYLDDSTANELQSVLKPLNDTQVDWEAYAVKLKETAAKNIKMDGSGLTAVSVGEKERLLYFSIPNDKGWKAYINGEETTIYTVNGGMMGIIAPAGESEIEFKYTQPGFLLGTYISLASILIIFILAILNAKKSFSKIK